MESDARGVLGGGAPELNALGKRIELLRIDRGISKQELARFAGTSRQQLWRVMTGKSELTSTFCDRLAEALGVEPRALRDGRGGENVRLYTGARPIDPSPRPRSLADYVADPDALLRTLSTLPTDAAGRRLKREVLNCVEVVAAESGLKLAPAFFQLRGRVINGEL